jgi:RNA polymerase sigma factor (TIGR02999 family)
LTPVFSIEGDCLDPYGLADPRAALAAARNRIMSKPHPPGDLAATLEAISRGDAQAASQLLATLYDELRRLARQKLAREAPGQTLDATALVHEAYLRLVGKDPVQPWDGRRHFFAAAAEAMRRILVEKARRRRLKHGGELNRQDFDPEQAVAPSSSDELLAVDQAVERLAQADSLAAELVKLRYFAGLSISQAAEVLGISPRSADRLWSYARAWLRTEIRPD